MEVIEQLAQLSLADEDVHKTTSSRRPSAFLSVVALGNTGAGKSAVLNSLIGHPVLPTGEGAATRAPVCIDLTRDGSLSPKSIIMQIGSKSHTQELSASILRHSLQDRLSKISGKNRDEICLKLRTSTGPSLKLIDLLGVDKENLDDSMSQYAAERNDAILLVVIPVDQVLDVATAKAIRIAKELDGECTRTVGVICKIDQASTQPKVLAGVRALLNNQGPRNTSDIPWVALIGLSVTASTQLGSVGADDSLETAWRAEREYLKSVLRGAPQSKLGRLAFVEILAQQIRNRMKVKLPNLPPGNTNNAGSGRLGVMHTPAADTHGSAKLRDISVDLLHAHIAVIRRQIATKAEELKELEKIESDLLNVLSKGGIGLKTGPVFMKV